jgi:RNA polymerase sigma-70 factor (ECF subfamily)
MLVTRLPSTLQGQAEPHPAVAESSAAGAKDSQDEDAPPVAFDDLYRRFGPTIYARCRQMLREPAAAEDACQEVFLRIHARLETIRGIRQAFAWLYRTATNHCLNELRGGRLRPTLLASLPDRPSPVTDELRFATQDLVVRLGRELAPELATVAWLYHVDELEQAEIAAICGISRRTVIARLGRFMEQARLFLARSDHAGGP